MRVVSLNGAAFIFLQRGERLRENEGLVHNKFPDQRYVLWPRGQGWDVRVKVHQFAEVSWQPIAESHFASEEEAWQAAWKHMSDRPTVNYKNDTEIHNFNRFITVGQLVELR